MALRDSVPVMQDASIWRQGSSGLFLQTVRLLAMYLLAEAQKRRLRSNSNMVCTACTHQPVHSRDGASPAALKAPAQSGVKYEASELSISVERRSGKHNSSIEGPAGSTGQAHNR
jgi:hypothetical protein